jgi:hypothetical protein
LSLLTSSSAAVKTITNIFLLVTGGGENWKNKVGGGVRNHPYKEKSVDISTGPSESSLRTKEKLYKIIRTKHVRFVFLKSLVRLKESFEEGTNPNYPGAAYCSKSP